jgi:uncharacterized protein DUF6144
MICMKEQTLIDLYKTRGLSYSEIETAVQAYRDYVEFLGQRTTNIEQASLEDIQTYIKNLQLKKTNTSETLTALARAHYLADNNQVYIYFTQILERENIIKNLRTHIETIIGEDESSSLFKAINVPLSGSPPDTAVPFTRSLVTELQDRLPKEIVVKALCGNAHGIPASTFAKEREYFLKSSSLATYLEDSHKRSVDILDEHHRSGKVWFEQEISADTVEYVREHREILGGVLRDGIIYWTKIPFKPAAWLKEEDPQKKRYLACHCPMAREALADSDGRFPRVWCNCTAGYVKQRFNAIFDTETHVELLDSVLGGDDRCRFAIRVPEGILKG